ncbi:MAG: YihY/virulence factor BrkB family protein [Oculatellaceae cyanobacterium Prado106]|nr:YihY/virulence factor BrkB family protein [Oculatellaceae cyanobacterium Prado106]
MSQRWRDLRRGWKKRSGDRSEPAKTSAAGAVLVQGWHSSLINRLYPRSLLFFKYCTPRTVRRIVVAAGRRRLSGLAAEMAYNAMLAIFPTMLAVLTAVGLFAPLQTTFLGLAGRIGEVAPTDALSLLKGIAEQIISSQNRGLFSFSFIFALWAASGALSTAMSALDEIHRIPVKRKRPFWKARLVALVLTMSAIVLLMLAASLVFVSDIAVRRVAEQSGGFAGHLLWGWWLLSLPLVLLIMSILFAFIYRFGPSRWNPGQPILPGAVLAAVSWAIVSNLLRLAVRYIGTNQIYGVVGAVIVLLLWLYMSSFVLLVGVQINVTVGEAMRRSQSQG